MNDQTPLATATRPLLADEGLARKFGDWNRDVALDHQGGAHEIHDFMAHPDSVNRLHVLINSTAKEYQATKPLRERRTSLILTLGQWKDKKTMIKSNKDKGHQVSDYAQGVIHHKDFRLLGAPEEWEFVPALVKEVTGHDKVVTTTELYAARDALGLGFTNGPSESACAIREAYTDQPMDEYRYVLTEPTPVAYGDLTVLRVARDYHGSWVCGHYAGPDSMWHPGDRLFLCRKRQLAT